VDVGLCVERPAYEEIDYSRQPEQKNKRRVPGGVEDIAGEQQIDLFLSPAERKVVKNQHDDKEEDESIGVEDHGESGVSG
jgi:hypothetical protein